MVRTKKGEPRTLLQAPTSIDPDEMFGTGKNCPREKPVSLLQLTPRSARVASLSRCERAENRCHVWRSSIPILFHRKELYWTRLTMSLPRDRDLCCEESPCEMWAKHRSSSCGQLATTSDGNESRRTWPFTHHSAMHTLNWDIQRYTVAPVACKP